MASSLSCFLLSGVFSAVQLFYLLSFYFHWPFPLPALIAPSRDPTPIPLSFWFRLGLLEKLAGGAFPLGVLDRGAGGRKGAPRIWGLRPGGAEVRVWWVLKGEGAQASVSGSFVSR